MDELLNRDCKIIKIPYAPLEPNKNYGLTKYYVVKLLKLNFFFETLRGIAFFKQAKDCDVIHFDQVLRSFGILSFSILLFLLKLIKKKVIITVHELDPLQDKYKSLNKYYNKADKIIVFSQDFKEKLIDLGVKENKIEIIHYGVSIPRLKEYKRDQFIFFGGHKLLKGKGFDTLLSALKILESKGKDLRLVIYVGEGCAGLEEGKKMVSDMGLDKYVTWSDFLFGSMLAEAYQKSIGCIIPYTGGSGRYPATTAMANATPVIATKKASLPEYLGELGIYVEENSAQELADAMTYLMDNPEFVQSLGNKLRKHAEEKFSKDLIGKETFKIYRELMV
jgi:glycosyltransferase involved in cell wall biosynthesis